MDEFTDILRLCCNEQGLVAHPSRPGLTVARRATAFRQPLERTRGVYARHVVLRHSVQHIRHKEGELVMPAGREMSGHGSISPYLGKAK